MPRPRQPARLYLEPERRYPDGRLRSPATWVIRDGGKKISTGRPAKDPGGAQNRFTEYLATLAAEGEIQMHRGAADVLISDVIAYYAQNAGPEVADPKEFSRRLTVLLDWWGDRTLDKVTGYTCKKFIAEHTSKASARRQLQDFSAAIKLYKQDGLCRDTVEITLPDPSDKRIDFLTRDQVATLIWYLYRYRLVQRGKPTKRFIHRHIVPFVLTAVYTGTRSSRIWKASFVREEGRPWIDVESGIFFRAAQGERVSPTKRANAVRIPDRLLAHMRRWAKSRRYLCQWNGKPADPRKGLFGDMKKVFGEDHPYVRHTLRHTCATWLLWSGTDIGDIAAYLSMTRDVLMKVYGHEHPDADRSVGEAFSTGKAGRRGKRK